jgi:hypothetical protein
LMLGPIAQHLPCSINARLLDIRDNAVRFSYTCCNGMVND